jgi:hypothetical protein
MKKFTPIFISIFLIVAFFAFHIPEKAKASLSTFVRSDCYTAAATSSPAYQTPGNATSTVTCKLGVDGADKASVIVEVNASSTASIWNIYAEESMDGQDWFPIASNQSASTSPIVDVTTRSYASFTFASSTIGGALGGTNSVGINGTNNRNHYVFDVPIRMKQVRVYSALSGANGAIWVQIIPKAQI